MKLFTAHTHLSRVLDTETLGRSTDPMTGGKTGAGKERKKTRLAMGPLTEAEGRCN